MIIQSPESVMPEPYKTYVRQRSETIANVLRQVVNDRNVQLCPRAITSDERIYYNPSDILYGVLVQKETDGYKSVLYEDAFQKDDTLGLVTTDMHNAFTFAQAQLNAGNRIRVKDPTESDGKGQLTAESLEEFGEVFENIAIKSGGQVVVMPHLETISNRISVGQIRLADIGSFLYFGQEEAQLYEGKMVYGGTTLGLFHDQSLNKPKLVEAMLQIPHELVELGLKSLQAYHTIAGHIGRVSVDVIEGKTDNGTTFKDVVDITPRVGGTTPAEVLAMQAIHEYKDGVCFAKSQLIYNPDESPITGTNFIDTKSLVINAQVLEVQS